MRRQPIPSKFPYIWGKLDCLFNQCTVKFFSTFVIQPMVSTVGQLLAVRTLRHCLRHRTQETALHVEQVSWDINIWNVFLNCPKKTTFISILDIKSYLQSKDWREILSNTLHVLLVLPFLRDGELVYRDTVRLSCAQSIPVPPLSHINMYYLPDHHPTPPHPHLPTSNRWS